MGSVSGLLCEVGAGHYCASKAGVHGLTRSMAVDFAQWGIRVNTVAPGWVHTETAAAALPPPGEPLEGYGVIKRAADPEEIGSAIAFLASDVCGMTTGATYIVDGGKTIV